MYVLPVATKPDNIDPQVQEIFVQFENVFSEPKGLPPYRSHDHKIPTIWNQTSRCSDL